MDKNHLQKIIRLRHMLHRCPELSMQEKKTAEILKSFLGENTSLDICSREGWFFAVKRRTDRKAGPGGEEGEGRSGTAHERAVSSTGEKHSDGCTCDFSAPIAFRADMDALPIPETISLPYGSVHEGISHKCGHDGHSTALCGLALELEKTETCRDIYLIFQPGEETGKGAVLCSRLIRERGIGEIYAFHNLGGYPEGSFVYREGLTQPASEGLRIRLIGKASHASAPEKGKNPARALARIVIYAQETAANTSAEHDSAPGTHPESMPMRLCTVTGLQAGGGDFGISPGEGEICMTLRADEEEEMKAMEAGILSFAEITAAEEGLKMEYSIHDRFPETRNHAPCLRRALEAAKRLNIPVIPMTELWRASEDFGHYLKECPGALFYIGNGEKYPALHTSDYDFNDRILEAAVDLFRELACETPFTG